MNLPVCRRASLFVMSVLSVSVATADTIIDNFESVNSPAPWTFYNGAEFPGATGSLSSGTGYHGQGAHLAYDFTGGGNYVSADLNLATPLDGEAVGFRVRAPGGCWITLRVRDATGQTLQYSLSRPLEAADSNAWYQQIVELDAPTLYFGGANDGLLHGSIVGISVMAGNFGQFGFEHGLVGAIDLDEVVLITVLQLDLNPFNTPLVPPPPGKGNLMSNLGVMIHFPMYPNYTIDTAALDAVRDAGFSVVRMDLFWSDVETTSGVYNFSNFDTLLMELEVRGLRPLFILNYGNSLHSDCPAGNPPEYCFDYGPQSPATIDAFGDYAEAAANHFAGHGVRYEVWNEPNHPTYWKPAPDANQYSTLAQEAIARIHLGDPSTAVTTAGLSGFDFKFLRSVLNLGGANQANAVAIHPYRQNAPESATDELVHMRSIVDQALSSTVPIWDTEWGYSSQWFGGDGAIPSARNRQAVMVLRKLLSAQVMGFPLSIYYDIRDDGTNPTNPEHNFGLIANDYSDKPAMLALRTLKSVASNRIFVGSLPTQPTNLHALRLDGSTDSVIVLWSDQPGGGVTVTLPASATATDMFGVPLSLVTANGRVSFSVTEADGPVYVTLPLPKQLRNISTRVDVLTGNDVAIGGFIINGFNPKKVIIRGIGPTLESFGLQNFLSDPTLELHNSTGALTASNDNWKDTQLVEIQATGLAPSDDAEPAIIATLDPGAYTAIIAGKNNGTGIGLIEIYDLTSPYSVLANISTRGFVGTGDNVMIGGTIIGPNGGASKSVIVRAIGPTLVGFGIPNALQDPVLELRDASGALIAANDNWRDSQQAAIQSTGLAPSDNRESAILATVPPGSYTAIVQGVNAGTGIALIEVYGL